MAQCYEIDGVRPVIHPTAFVHPTAVLIGDVIVGPGCYLAPLSCMRGDFATNLLGKIDLPLTFWGERMSTQAVERAMLEEDMTRKRRADRIDPLAATYILQAALDALPRS